MYTKITLLPFLIICLSSYAFAQSQEDKLPTYSDVAGKNYYLLTPDFYCKASAPGRPEIKTWKDRIEFTDGKVYVWQTLCNDNPIIEEFSAKRFRLSKDARTLTVDGQEYKYYSERPKLCKAGLWCPKGEKE